MKQLYLRQDFSDHLQGRDPFEYISRVKGTVFRKVARRVTLRFEVEGKGYFLKWHKGVGWGEILKNLLSFKAPILGARNEWQAIKALTEADIGTMTLVAYGEHGANPANKESFVITEALDNTISLEDLCEPWLKEPPSYRFKRKLIKKVALMARALRQIGLNHRDFYICHFLLDTSSNYSQQTADELKLHIIDLHRAQIREEVPYRWLVKDIGSLYFSAMDIGLTKQDLYYFMKVYADKPLRLIFREELSFWQDVQKRAEQLYRKPSPEQELASNGKD